MKYPAIPALTVAHFSPIREPVEGEEEAVRPPHVAATGRELPLSADQAAASPDGTRPKNPTEATVASAGQAKSITASATALNRNFAKTTGMGRLRFAAAAAHLAITKLTNPIPVPADSALPATSPTVNVTEVAANTPVV